MACPRLLLAAVVASLGVCASQATADTFSYTGAEQTYTVPAGTSWVRITASGATGGWSSGSGVVGGVGATVDTHVPVTPGQVLYVNVGGAGSYPGAGGWNGGGNGGPYGAGGGGASDVRTTSGDLSARIVVAAGGGGNGATYAGQSGGDAGSAGQSTASGAGGGQPGTQTAGGAGGTSDCAAGAVGGVGTGGAGGTGSCSSGGGGGGGGYYGGGGGGGSFSAAAGGGGGSSHVVTGAKHTTISAAAAGAGTITIVPATSVLVGIAAPATGSVYGFGQSAPTTYTCTAPSPLTVSSCTDSNGATGGAGALDTATLGTHTYTVTATDSLGQTASRSITYTVAAAPTVTISTPATGGVYRLNQPVATAFSCSVDPAVTHASCTDANGATADAGLDTRTAGTHTYTVTVTDSIGQTASRSVSYTVIAPPATPTISGATDGATYRLGQVIPITYPCTAQPGATVTTCHDSNGGVNGTGTLDTQTVGAHTHTVTITDSLGQTTTATITYTVAGPACPTRPRFNSIIYRDSVTSFYYRPLPGQTIRGARHLGKRLPTMLNTPRGRSLLPRIEYTTARPVDAKRLPWFARKVGPNRVIAAILTNTDSTRYAGIRLAYRPKPGTSAKLILPTGTVQTTFTDCPTTTGYDTIYSQIITVTRRSK